MFCFVNKSYFLWRKEDNKKSNASNGTFNFFCFFKENFFGLCLLRKHSNVCTPVNFGITFPFCFEHWLPKTWKLSIKAFSSKVLLNKICDLNLKYKNITQKISLQWINGLTGFKYQSDHVTNQPFNLIYLFNRFDNYFHSVCLCTETIPLFCFHYTIHF